MLEHSEEYDNNDGLLVRRRTSGWGMTLNSTRPSATSVSELELSGGADGRELLSWFLDDGKPQDAEPDLIQRPPLHVHAYIHAIMFSMPECTCSYA